MVIKKLVVLGGTFNPPHLGHLNLAKAALSQLGADEVLFMTAGNPPHKENAQLPDKKHRFEMVKLLTENYSAFAASDIEIKSDEKSYTANTLLKLSEIYKGYKIYFIVGLDSFYDIEKWYKPEEIFKRCVIAVALRGGVSSDCLLDKIKYYKEKFNAEIVNILMPEIDISSSFIREKLSLSEPVENMLTKEVMEYIEKNGLYKEQK